MTSNLDNTRRALRLLRWYPRDWRDHYGEEFVDHLEQEFAERPVDLKRSINVTYKGLLVRVGDIGLSRAGARDDSRSRAALGTSFALTALAAVLALGFWARTMMTWNEPGVPRATVPVTVAIGALTIITGVMLVVLVATVIAVAVVTIRQMIRGQIRALLGPSIVATVSGLLVLAAAKFFYFGPGYFLPPIPWARPGLAIKVLAQMGWLTSLRLDDLWSEFLLGPSRFQGIIDALSPLFLLAFGVAIATLIRRVDVPHAMTRVASGTVVLLGILTSSFLIAYVMWIVLGGVRQVKYFASPQSQCSGIVDLVFLALVAVLVWRSQRASSIRKSEIVIVTGVTD